jgi:hypothetical protein
MRSEVLALSDVVGRPAGYQGEAHRGWATLTLLSARPRGTSKADRRDGVDLLGRVPYVSDALARMACDFHSVRLMTLAPGGVIAEHHDPFLGFEHGLIRLHVPVTTHRDVDFRIDGQRCAWGPGELWYGDFSRPHSAHNRSDVSRIHLVLDVHADEQLLALFPQTFAARARAEIPRPSASAALTEAHAFEFAFELPPGFSLPGMNPLTAARHGCVCRAGNALIAFLEGEPFLRLEPVSPDCLKVHGLPAEASVTVWRDGECVRRAVLELAGTAGVAIELNVA